MKYIVTVLNGLEVIFVFPRIVNHDRFAEGMESIRFGDHHIWERPMHRAVENGKIVAAGFIDNGECHGYSESLGIGSRGAADTALLAQAFPSTNRSTA